MSYRRAALALGTCLLSLPATAAAATTDVTIGNNFFQPSSIDIAAGDTAHWTWAFGSVSHSVTSNSYSQETYDSGVRNGPSDFSRQFNNAGCFRYHCSVHSSMQGTIRVGGASCEQPAPVPPAGAPDTTPPVLNSLRVRPRTLRVSFALSEAANVRGSLVLLRRARLAAKLVRRLRVVGRQGRNAFRLSRRGVEPGDYRISLRAKDAAGNVSSTARRSFSFEG
jgi:plastocyanin